MYKFYYFCRIGWLSNEGSPGSKIDRCDLMNFEYLARKEFNGFSIRFQVPKNSNFAEMEYIGKYVNDLSMFKLNKRHVNIVKIFVYNILFFF